MGKGRKIGLIIFALVDLVLIAAIVLLVHDSGIVNPSKSKNGEAPAQAVSEVTQASESVQAPGMTQSAETAPAPEMTQSTEAAQTAGQTQASGEAQTSRTELTMSELDALQEALAEIGDSGPSVSEDGETISEAASVSEAEPAAAAAGTASVAEPAVSADIVSGPESAASADIVSGPESAASAAESPDLSSLPPTKRCYLDGTFWEGCPERDIQLLTPNPYSRPQYALEEVHDIVIHYVGNPGSSAQQNRDYFESLQDGSRSASSHFVVGLEGEIIQCVSCSEWSYASNSRNFDTISIECCHPDSSGQFTDATYRSVVELTAWLCKAFEIGPEHVIRHYDITGKLCPKYYVVTDGAWEQMLSDIRTQYDSISGE